MLFLLLTACVAPTSSQAQWRVCGLPLTALDSNQYPRAIVPDGSGGALIVWEWPDIGPVGTVDQLRVTAVTATGERPSGWPVDGVILSDVFGNVGPFGPVVATTDGAGGVIVAWPERRTTTGDKIFAQHITASGAVAAGWTASSKQVTPASAANPTFCSIATDGTGGAYIAWHTSQREVCLIRLAGDGSVVPGWSAAGDTVTALGMLGSDPALVPDGSGGALVLYSGSKSDGSSIYDVYAQRFDAGGDRHAGWSLGGVALCRAVEYQRAIRATPDGTGGAFALWHDTRAGLVGVPADVYAQHVLGDGSLAPGWPVDGLSLCGGSPCKVASALDSGVLVPDGAGGMFAAWVDLRSGTTTDIYGHHLTPAGSAVAGWPSGGLPLSTAPGGEYTPDLQPDGAGGFFLAWTRLDSGIAGITLTRVTGDGTPFPGWTLAGMRPYCTLYTTGGLLARDASDGVIVAASGGASSGVQQEVYAAHVAGDAVVTSAPPGADRVLGNITLAIESPSPAGAPTTIRFVLPNRARVQLDIFDLAGRRLRALHSDAAVEPGLHELQWDGRDEAGRSVAAGVYLARVHAVGQSVARSFVRLR